MEQTAKAQIPSRRLVLLILPNAFQILMAAGPIGLQTPSAVTANKWLAVLVRIQALQKWSSL